MPGQVEKYRSCFTRLFQFKEWQQIIIFILSKTSTFTFSTSPEITNLSIFVVTIVALSSVMSLSYFTCSGTVNDCNYTHLEGGTISEILSALHF